MTDDRKAHVRRFSSPGEPKTHSFILVTDDHGTLSAAPAELGSGDYVVHRPSRAEMRQIMSLAAVGFSGFGINADVLNNLDGRMRLADAYLTIMLTTAPAHWWSSPVKGEPPMIALDGAALYEDEIMAVWHEVRRFLSQFAEFHNRPGVYLEPSPAPAPAASVGDGAAPTF